MYICSHKHNVFCDMLKVCISIKKFGNYICKGVALTAFVILVATFANATNVDRQRALRVAAGFWHTNISPVESIAEFRISDVSNVLSCNNIYIVVRKNGEGFVIVSADDRVRPILAYSPRGNIDTATMPCNTSMVLRSYNRQIQYCIDKNLATTLQVLQQWIFYAKVVTEMPSSFSYYSPLYYGDSARLGVPPMLTSTWNQSWPYNSFCPYDSTYGDISVVGCVATAMSQIMRYWEYPRQGVDSNSYHDNTYAEVGIVRANFGNTIYDWANMPDALTGTSNTSEIGAVAQLCFHCGVSVNMRYSSLRSGAIANNFSASSSYPCAENALKNYFRYSQSLHSLWRDHYFNNDSAWNTMLIGELNEGRPILYAGSDSSAGGHVFICDGYDAASGSGTYNIYFHFNWGWGGAYDGYFTTNNLVPQGGGIGSNATHNFNTDQSVIVGIEPGTLDTSWLRVSPMCMQMPATSCTSLVVVHTTNIDSCGWTAMSTAPWIHLLNNSGSGAGTAATILFTIDSNQGLSRKGKIVVRQGSIVRMVEVLQNSSSYSPAGYYGFVATNGYYMPIGTSCEVIMRADALGNFAQGDTITHVFFKSIHNTNDGYGAYDNNSYKISIYENPNYTQELREGNLVPASSVLSSPVYTQNYFQRSYGLHEIPLETPYVIGHSPFWVGLKLRGPSQLVLNVSYSSIPMSQSSSNIVDSIKGLYLLRTPYDSVFVQFASYTDTTYQCIILEEYNYCIGFKLLPRMGTHVTIIAESSDTNRGTVSGGGSYYYGDMVILNALPKTGYCFDRWQDGNRDNPRTFTLLGPQTQPLSFVASFGVESITQAETNDFAIAVMGRTIAVSGVENNTIRLFDVMGRTILSERGNGDTKKITVPTKGVYIVKVGDKPARKILVLK